LDGSVSDSVPSSAGFSRGADVGDFEFFSFVAGVANFDGFSLGTTAADFRGLGAPSVWMRAPEVFVFSDAPDPSLVDQGFAAEVSTVVFAVPSLGASGRDFSCGFDPVFALGDVVASFVGADDCDGIARVELGT
jgi:hypothetical protein